MAHPPVMPRASLRLLRRQRGAGALIVVLVLFFIMSMVAAYSSRNMIFEQRTSANQYRSTQAFEAADAGVEWALAMLNAGSIDDACTPVTVAPALPGLPPPSFRGRYISIDANTGAIAPKTWLNGATTQFLNVLCARDAGGWACSCPSNSAPVLAVPAGPGPAPAFRLTFVANGRPGVVGVRSQGCTRLSTSCLNDAQTATGGDATATVSALLALKGAVSTPPSAALTVHGDVAATSVLNVVNTDSNSGGVTIDAGGTVIASDAGLRTLPGTPVAVSIVSGDAALAALSPDLMFASVFGMRRDTYRQQPAAIVRTCPGQCAAADLADVVRLNPGRMLWLVGDVDLASPVELGSPTNPVVIVVNGNFTASAAGARVNGVVYSYNAAGQWATAGSGLIQGAAVAEGGLLGSATTSIVFDADILRRLRLQAGSFVRVPGGWKDF